MRFLVRIERPILPPNHVPGARLPDKVLLEIGEYQVNARDGAAVIEQFEAAKASGLEHLHGRTIRSITPWSTGGRLRAASCELR